MNQFSFTVRQRGTLHYVACISMMICIVLSCQFSTFWHLSYTTLQAAQIFQFSKQDQQVLTVLGFSSRPCVQTSLAQIMAFFSFHCFIDYHELKLPIKSTKFYQYEQCNSHIIKPFLGALIKCQFLQKGFTSLIHRDHL